MLFDVNPQLRQAADRIVRVIRRLSANRSRPLLVALDGGSGAGKSAVAALIETNIAAVVVPGDDFFAADLTHADWERRTPAEKARDAIDWRRLRAEALEPLLSGKRAAWFPFDFASGTRPNGTVAVSDRAEVRESAPVIILEGAYSARPELSDLIDLSVLIDVSIDVRHRRLAEREAVDFLDEWHQRWDAAEAW